MPRASFFLPLRARAREMLSFVQLLILQGGKESPQFEASNPIIAQPPENRITTGHFRIEANMGTVRARARIGLQPLTHALLFSFNSSAPQRNHD
jgi:hypothetical protein